jgi:hypothetical protein
MELATCSGAKLDSTLALYDWLASAKFRRR